MIIDILRKILPSSVKEVVKEIVLIRFYSTIFKISFKQKLQKLRPIYKRLIFIVATPRHNNLGDHAIVYAELKFLKDMGLGERVIEISNTDYLNNKEFIKKYISSEDLLIIDGGGSMGILWPQEDDKITEIIDTYSNNTIIVFPQTCFYTAGIESEKRLLRNKHVYQQAKKLIIALRDQRSYEFCVKTFLGVNFICIPDIVLYINYWEAKKRTERDGILLCFRNDLEKVISNVEVAKIKNCLERQCINYNEVSTLAERPIISKKRRNFELFKKWNEFASAKMVITDRLHGMIFAAITRTPCLAVDNLSHKVSGVYNLMPNICDVIICKNVDDILCHIKSYYNMEINNDFDIPAKDEYQLLQDIIFNKMNQ